MEYELKFSKEFEKEFEKIGNPIRQEAWKKILRLKENPTLIGKHLRYLDLWELHVQMFRIFYVIDENKIKLLMLSIKHKDDCDKYVRGLSPEKIKQLLSSLS